MEHRWSVRKPQQCRVVVDTPRHGPVAAKLLDIGIGGMFIEAEDIGLPLNTSVNVAFSLMREADREDFRLPAMVIRHAPNGAGVMFLDVDVDTLRALRRVLYEPTKPELERSLPATGAIARTATNVRAGGRTPVAGIVHALVILLVTVGAGSLAGYLAMPALSALLIVTAWIMSEPGRWRERMSLRPGDRTLLFMTMILTVVTDLTIAIAIGTIAGLALRLTRRDVESAEWKPSDRSKL